MQTKSTDSSKQRASRNRASCFAIPLGMSLLTLTLYFSYCWGLWGRHSLLLQYLFQCSCPDLSAELRYPKEVDVIVPACRYWRSTLSPSGRLLYVQEKDGSSNSTYFLDLQTSEKMPFTLSEGSNHFITDNFVFHSHYGDDEYILDITTGNNYPIQNVTKLKPNIFSMGDVDPRLLLEALSKVDQIFLIDEIFQPVVAISLDFRTHPENSFVFDVLDFPGDEPDRVEQFLKEFKIVYNYVPADFPQEVLSPNGRFIARKDGIYLVETDQKIVDGFSPSGNYRDYSGRYFSVRGWSYDSSGAIYSKFLNPCLVEMGILDEVGCFIPVPQPLIKLKVPEEYLLRGSP